MRSPPEGFLALVRHVDDVVETLVGHPDERVQDLVVTLLGGLDAIHRDGLARLIAALRADGAGDSVERACADPVVATVLGLYDLAELPLPEPAAPTASGLVQIRLPSRGER